MRRFLNGMEKACIVATVSCLAVMVATNIIQIFFRYVLNSAFVWVHPLTMLLFIWMTFLGAFVVYHQKKDIVVMFVVNRLSGTSRQAVQLTTHILIILLLALILYQGPTLIRQQSSRMQIIPLPRYFQVIPLLIGIAGILLDSIMESLSALPARFHKSVKRKDLTS